MQQFIGCDAHKKFSVFVAVNEKGQAGEAIRVEHDGRLYREFLSQLPKQSAIAIEASGHYGWLVSANPKHKLPLQSSSSKFATAARHVSDVNRPPARKR